MHQHPADTQAMLWFAGWLIALATLGLVGLRVPLQTRLAETWARLFNAGVVLAIVAVAALANVAVVLHDMHLDLTRAKVFTPSERALEVVDRLRQPVQLTYYFRAGDQVGRRAADLVQVMGRRNPLLTVRTVDPDKEPTRARSAGIKIYNAAVLEAGGRRITVNTVDETEIAIGIQRVLRERVITACFVEGHQEYPMDGFEFHTHLEGGVGHSHDDASSAVVQTSGHGVGRLRRVLEELGYDARKVILAVEGSIPESCSLVVVAGPRTTFLPDESIALRSYLERGGALMLLLDLGFVLEPGLESLLGTLGIALPQQVLIDPKSHYGKDPETVAATAYPEHPITRRVSLTFFPGVRPLQLTAPSEGVRTRALIESSEESYTSPVTPMPQRQSDAPAKPDTGGNGRGVPARRPFAAVSEGALSGGAEPGFRAVVVGDADFATNSFLPYMANSDLALSLVRWLAREEESTPIASRIPVPPRVLLTDAQAHAVFLTVVVLMPLVALLTGAAVWWARR